MDLEIYNAFVSAGLSNEAAQSIVGSINKAIDSRYSLHSQQLATQGDIEKVRLELEKVRAELKTDIEKVRADISKAEAAIIKWNVGALVALATFGIALARIFVGN